MPNKEAVEYGRNAVQTVRDKYARWEAEARVKGDEKQAEGWRRVVWALDRELLGYDEPGCVVTALDKRWLDDTFRDWYSGAPSDQRSDG